MAHHKQRMTEGCECDMTPMIDVVFQLIIFFIVTIKLEETHNPDIELEYAKHGPVIKEQDPRTMVIEVDQRGWITMHGARMSQQQLAQVLQGRYNRMGVFPVLIRADHRTRHQDVRRIMDTCTAIGIWRISFAALIEKKM